MRETYIQDNVARASQHDKVFSTLNPSAGSDESALPVENPTKAFWQINLDPNEFNLAKEGSTGELTSDADICIIGSGATGVSAAYHFVKLFSQDSEARGDSSDQPSIRVVVLEAREFCSGATGRNGGHLTPVSFSGFASFEASYGREHALANAALEEYVSSSIRTLVKENGWAKAISFVENKRNMLFLSEEERQKYLNDYKCAEEAGLPHLGDVDWLEMDEVMKQYGIPFPMARKPANNLWPYKLYTKIFKKALEDAPPGLEIKLHTMTPVTSMTPLQQSEGRRWTLHTPRGNISCRYVLHATNGYASHLLPFLKGPTGIVPTRGQVIATLAAASARGLSDSGWVANKGYEYWFHLPAATPDERQTVIIGGLRELEKNFEFYQVDDSELSEKVSKELGKFLPELFRGKFEEKATLLEWTGIMGFTKSTCPFVGPVLDAEDPANEKYEGQFVAAGYTGHGMPRAYACAEAVAQMIFADMKRNLSGWQMPEWLPEKYLTRNKI